ncbi:MAG TPA: type I DNA topoisomerase [Thermoanaerobaculia bacterium]|nr:type I DNA topoisomerase [Thermoanaerobaculia bacterium]
MSRSIVIVESPAKAKTIEKFLGKGFRVLASYGHVRDLPKKGLGVDRGDGYAPTYEILKGKEKTIEELRRAVKTADAVYLAADPDREGEAISWHLHEALKAAGKGKPFKRVRFNEITRKAVLAAMENAGEIDDRLVDAQQARRIIDRLVGYEVSDLLWKKVWRGLSAGRVQTVALRIICDRERAIEAFRPVEFWTVDAQLEAGAPPAFAARLFSFDGEKLKFDGTDPRLADEAAALRVRDDVQKAAWTVAQVETSERRKNSPPPFITSQLQQAASRRLGFAVRRTMQIAQRLYEGKEIPGRGTLGLITYMRTDSTRVSADALSAVRELIAARYGADSLPESPRFFKSKRDVQDAHEAIRPTYLDLPPEAVASYLTEDEVKLYRLIWERFVGSQMSAAVYDTVSADITADRAVYRASGSTLKFAGYLAAYGIAADDDEEEATPEKEGAKLPPLSEGETLKLVSVTPEKKETQPPPRFNEASLVKFLEENGIGRPSTFAEILRKLEQREYVHKKDRRFIPTALGRTVIELLIPYFDDFFETGYTARMEEMLDEVEEGKLSWTKALFEFDKTFTRDRDRALSKMVSSKAGIPLAEARRILSFPIVPETAEKCERCGKKLKLRMGKNGLFVACSGYPDCTFTQNIPDPEEDTIDAAELENRLCDECGSPMKLRQSRTGSAFLGCTAFPKCRNVISVSIAGGKAEARPDEPTGQMCPESGHPLVRRHGRYGAYVACSGYPACRYKPPKPVKDTLVRCPKDGGVIAERRGRFRAFYGCVNYPNCDFTLSARPVPEACPKCGNAYLLLRERKGGNVFACDAAGCGFEKPAGGVPALQEVFLPPSAAASARPKSKPKSAPEEGPAPKEKPKAKGKGKGKAKAGTRPKPKDVKPPASRRRAG